MNYSVKLDNFEGPLDLLLYLVRKNELDIQQIPIVSITQQYIDYLEIMKALNLDIAGEFLVMAATLLYLKSRAIIPVLDEQEAAEEQNTLEDLKRQLLEYQQYKEAAQHLKEQNILEKDVFTRGYYAEPVHDDGGTVLKEASIFDLLTALKKVIERTGTREDIYDVSVEHISVKDKISEILQRLQDTATNIEFDTLFPEKAGKIEIITTFLALLELIKMQAIRIYQNSNFSRIYIYPVSAKENEKITVPEDNL